MRQKDKEAGRMGRERERKAQRAHEKETKQTIQDPKKVGGTTKRDERAEARLKPMKYRKRSNATSKES